VLLIGDVALAYDIGGLLAHKRLGVKLMIVLLDNGGGGIFDFLPVSDASMARAPAGDTNDPGEPQRAIAPGEASGRARDDEDIYTRHIATPTDLDFAAAATLYGLGYERVATTSELRAALERALAPEVGSTIVHVCSERARNVELHRRVWGAVSAAISPSA
jgi:2-succinyl-5-enolpyruvyl-6-hydroxy-3-cyclohexene-1-carboxylate synthase